MEYVILSATGRLARVVTDAPYTVAHAATREFRRADHDVIAAWAAADDGAVGLLASDGTAYRLATESLPILEKGEPWSMADAPEVAALVSLADGTEAVGLMTLDLDAPPLALGTASGVVKRVTPEYKGWESWTVIALKEDDRVIGAGHAADADDVVFITSDAQLLRTQAREIRPQGRAAGGMAGLKLAEDATPLWFGTVAKADRDDAVVATLTRGRQGEGTVKMTPFAEYPAKGRATGGVRTHRFLTGQTELVLGWVGTPPVRACDVQGHFRNLPAANDRRDGSGARVSGAFHALGG